MTTVIQKAWSKIRLKKMYKLVVRSLSYRLQERRHLYMQEFTCSLTMILDKTLTDLLKIRKRKKEKDDFIIPDKQSKYGCLE